MKKYTWLVFVIPFIATILGVFTLNYWMSFEFVQPYYALFASLFMASSSSLVLLFLVLYLNEKNGKVNKSK